MNRHQRRAAAARAGKRGRRHDGFYESFIRHLPETPVDAPLVPGSVNFLVFHHDDKCAFHATGDPSDCTCSPTIASHHDPVRQ